MKFIYSLHWCCVIFAFSRNIWKIRVSPFLATFYWRIGLEHSIKLLYPPSIFTPTKNIIYKVEASALFKNTLTTLCPGMKKNERAQTLLLEVYTCSLSKNDNLILHHLPRMQFCGDQCQECRDVVMFQEHENLVVFGIFYFCSHNIDRPYSTCFYSD